MEQTVRYFNLRNHSSILHRLCKSYLSLNITKLRSQLMQRVTNRGQPCIAVESVRTAANVANPMRPTRKGLHLHHDWPSTCMSQRRWISSNGHGLPLRNLTYGTDCFNSFVPKRNSGVCRHASTDPSCSEGNNSAKDDTDNRKTTQEKMSYIEARNRGVILGRRSLLPLERVGRMLATDLDNEGVHTDQVAETTEQNELVVDIGLPSARADQRVKSCSVSHLTASSVGSGTADRSCTVLENPTSARDNPPMIDGEMVIAFRENYKRHEFLCRMFQLNARNEFRTKYGLLHHADFIGHLAGRIFSTDLDIDIMIRRPTLEEFVLYMRRTPVISYPKDCCTMLMMIDTCPGDVILEAGTGSGAMTLFLSRAVGSTGCIHTFEMKPEHQKRAMKNFKQWASSWNISHPQHRWPDNVCFHSGKLASCNKDLDSTLLVDGAVIDMERPYEAMPTLATRLKPGKAAVVYVANITQVIDLAEFLRVHELPLTTERILEVGHKVWVVNQARRHSGSTLAVPRLSTENHSSYESDAENEDSSSSAKQKTKYIEDNVPKYIARPHNIQPGHTAFLVTIRRVANAASTYKM